MIKIDWDEFKFFKSYNKKSDNFENLLDFLKSYYKMTSPKEMFATMQEDEIAQLMLAKREMHSVIDLEKYLYKDFNVQ